MSVVYLMIEWAIEIRRDADVVKHHCHYQFRQSCHLASIHTIPFHPILDELYVDCMSTALTSLPLVNVIGHRLANLIIPGTLQVHSLSPGRPMPGSRGCEGACYICMYVHTYILHPDIYPTYDFFFYLTATPRKYFSQNDCLHISSTATFPISPGCPTVLYQKRHSRSTPPSSQVSTLRSPAQSSNTG